MCSSDLGDLVFMRLATSGSIERLEFVDGFPGDGAVGGRADGPRGGHLEAGIDTGLFPSLVLVGGVAQSLMLPFLAVAALYFRYKQTDNPLQPGKLWTALLWVSALAMAAVGLFQFYQKLT